MSKPRLLFLDDEENILRALERLFDEDDEYEIHTATEGKEGIKLLEEHEFSVIVSDYRMPNMSGVEFLEIAKEKSPETIRIILTGFADMSVVIAAINKGEIYKFIEKPWIDENLQMQIKRASEHYDLAKDRKKLVKKINVQNSELKELNEGLENTVAEKTVELRLKIKELEGRDKILQSLLTVTTFEEALTNILEVILSIVQFSEIILYTYDQNSNNFVASVGLKLENSKIENLGDTLTKMPELPIPNLGKNDKDILLGVSPQNKINDYSYYVPIEHEGDCIGIILVDNTKSKNHVLPADLTFLAGFSSLAALAININSIIADTSNLQDHLDEFLEEFK